MDDLDDSDDGNEVVYDVSNIEELDHFDIGDDAHVLEIPEDQIDIMKFTVSEAQSMRMPTSRRKQAHRVVHLMKEELTLPTSSNKKTTGQKRLRVVNNREDLNDISEASRIFVTASSEAYHMGLPIYSDQIEKFNAAAQIIATAAVGIDNSLICETVPQEFTRTGTFIVSFAALTTRGEIGLDGLGPWGSPQGSSKYFKVQHNQIITAVVGDYDWKILCNRYTHPGTDSRGVFHKKVYTGINNENVPSSLAVIVYEWIGEPHAIALNTNDIPHTGSIKDKAFGNRSWEGRLDDILRDECLSYRELPLFSRICVDFESACRILLAHSQIQEYRVCTQVPQDFRECGTFVLDIALCAGERLIHRDGREWNKPSGSSRFFRMDSRGNAIRSDINNAHPGEQHDIQVILKRYETLKPVGLIRKIYVARDKSRRLASPLAVVTYMFKAPTMHKSTVCAGRTIGLVDRKRHLPTSAIREHFNVEESFEIEDEMYAIRKKTLEMQETNQNRFGLLLNRAECFLDRFEQAGNQILLPFTRDLVDVWKGSSSRRSSVRQKDLSTGSSLLTHLNEH